MRLLINIAVRQLVFRKRQSLVSLVGIVLGTGFFIAISSMMKGSENDFLKRLVDNSPHITISDEFRDPRVQPLEAMYPSNAAIEISNTRPVTETRGIRGFEKIIDFLKVKDPGIKVSQVLIGQGLVNYAGKDSPITLNGMIPEDILKVTTIEQNMVEGSIDDLIGYPDGIIIGGELARTLKLKLGNSISITASTGTTRIFKIVGIFRTGRSSYDINQSFLHLKRVQSLVNRPNKANSIIIKLSNPYNARVFAKETEDQVAYKNLSWQESSEDLINTIAIRNKIMYTVVSAVLIVAAFGIYNVISTVVMEKYRDIAILKSMGFYAKEIRIIFLTQGIMLGVAGCMIGVPLGIAFMYSLMQIKFKPPGGTQIIQMPIDWGITQFLVAITFAMTASILAAYLPARKAGAVKPVDILRGGAA